MQANYVERIRIKFSKVGATRFIGHLDVARALERALNRSRIPVAYTQGYNPRPRMQFAAALPLGFTSEGELADVWLEEEMDPEQARAQLAPKMPPGLIVHRVWEVSLSAPAMQASTVEATYEATVLDSLERQEVEERVRELLDAQELIRERRGKEYDLRPLVLDLAVDEAEDSELLLTMRLALLPGATGRPDEVVSQLGMDPLGLRMHRKAIVLEDDGG
ncbi:MAG TPA: TIGR03936 family radical SAM-associated protein [Candidatus Sulfomarinibacteraceae bacterium]|nr:TIGR03936 family radical SAM-associated protein [Candidatus Sulfomarinibacteraceae bacterium]